MATNRAVPQKQLPRLAQAVAAAGHPARLAILEALVAEPGQSPNALAPQIGHSLGTTAYHVRVLAGADLIEQTDTALRRGAVEHFYAATDDGRGMLDALQNALTGARAA